MIVPSYLIWKSVNLQLIEKYCKGIPTDVYNNPSKYQMAITSYKPSLADFSIFLRPKSILNLFRWFRNKVTIELEQGK